MKNHQESVVRLYNFEQAVSKRNPGFVPAVRKVVTLMLESPDKAITLELLLRMGGIGSRIANLITRVLQGEDVNRVIEGVTPISRPQSKFRERNEGRISDNWDGSWDNAVKASEDD